MGWAAKGPFLMCTAYIARHTYIGHVEHGHPIAGCLEHGAWLGGQGSGVRVRGFGLWAVGPIG